MEQYDEENMETIVNMEIEDDDDIDKYKIIEAIDIINRCKNEMRLGIVFGLIFYFIISYCYQYDNLDNHVIFNMVLLHSILGILVYSFLTRCYKHDVKLYPLVVIEYIYQYFIFVNILFVMAMSFYDWNLLLNELIINVVWYFLSYVINWFFYRIIMAIIVSWFIETKKEVEDLTEIDDPNDSNYLSIKMRATNKFEYRYEMRNLLFLITKILQGKNNNLQYYCDGLEEKNFYLIKSISNFSYYFNMRVMMMFNEKNKMCSFIFFKEYNHEIEYNNCDQIKALISIYLRERIYEINNDKIKDDIIEYTMKCYCKAIRTSYFDLLREKYQKLMKWHAEKGICKRLYDFADKHSNVLMLLIVAIGVAYAILKDFI